MIDLKKSYRRLNHCSSVNTLRKPRGEVMFLHNKEVGISRMYTTATGKDWSSTTALKKDKYFSVKYTEME